MAEFYIRRATAEDLDNVVDLCVALQAHLEDANPAIWRVTLDGWAERRRQLALNIDDDDALVLVVCDASENMIGTAIGHIQRHGQNAPSISGLIGRVFVREAWRRQGVGRALVERLADFFQERGVNEIAVQYVVGNQEAERFWTGLGFEPRIIRAGTSLTQLAVHLESGGHGKH